MIPSLPEVRMGEPMCCTGLAVFPLFHAGSGTLDYLLAHEALESGQLVVREACEIGSVPEMFAENKGDLPCLILEGTELRGSKQARMLNASVLVGSRSWARMPVSCVEHGRWRYVSPQSSAGSHCPPTLRALLKGSAGSRRQGLGSCQIALWAEISRKHRALGVTSTTEDLSSALEMHRERVAQLQERLPYPVSANGVAVALGGKLVSIDIVDKPVTLEKVWNRLTEGFALDGIETQGAGREMTAAKVSVALQRMRGLGWQPVEPVGLGEEWRARNDGMLANTLFIEGALLHASVSLLRVGHSGETSQAV
jgi:hypothetical protein